MTQFLFVLLLLSSFLSTASDTVGDSVPKKFFDAGDVMEVDPKGRPLQSCEDKTKMLEKSDCLRTDGKLAKHCMVKELVNKEEYQNDKLSCGQDWLIDYACRDFVICSLKDTQTKTKDEEKKPAQPEGAR